MIHSPSSQDRGIGTYTVPPRTTRRRTTTNLKIKNQNSQKIKLYGRPTAKELQKKHSSRPVGGAETGSQGVRTCGEMAAGGPSKSGRSHIRVRINQEEQLGSETDGTTQSSSTGK